MYDLYDIALAEEPFPGDLKIKITRSNLSQNCMDTTKTMVLTCLYLLINNTVVLFRLCTHLMLEIQSINHVHSKPKVHKVYGVILFSVS